jgi:hypothetical protein
MLGCGIGIVFVIGGRAAEILSFRFILKKKKESRGVLFLKN